MNHEEFLKTLEENKVLKDYDETIKQKFPVIKYYLKNYGPVAQTPQGIIDFKLCTIHDIANKNDWIAMNKAFAMLVELYKQGVFKKQ